jgi:uncharacterized metal-binding protein YceD (DUF177 family)
MRVDFRKIDRSPLPFHLQQEKMCFEGTLQRYNRNLLLLQAHLSGKLKTPCDLCGEETLFEVDEDLEFFVSDGVYKLAENEEYDVVEFYDGAVDMEALLHSEIELLKSGYNICKECE